jgi:hypothetical protein
MFTQRGLLFLGLTACLLPAASAEAQLVNDVNGLLVKPNVVRADPGNNLTIDATGFPNMVTLHEDPFSNNGNPTQFNRHDLMFSANGGASARKFQNQEAFDVSVDVTLSAGFDAPRKEAGLRVNFFGFDGQFIINTDADEIVAFGGTLPFYSFTAPVSADPPGGGLPGYVTGETINLRMIYTPPVLDDAMPPAVVEKGTIQYVIDRGAGPVSSPVIEFTGTESGIINNSEVGVYVQATGVFPVQPDFVDATFANFDFDGPDAVDNADFNGDAIVDGADFLIWQRGLGTPNALLADGDANDDSEVDSLDLGIWKMQFGAAATPVAALVPEPASLAIVAGWTAALAAAFRRRTNMETT